MSASARDESGLCRSSRRLPKSRLSWSMSRCASGGVASRSAPPRSPTMSSASRQPTPNRRIPSGTSAVSFTQKLRDQMALQPSSRGIEFVTPRRLGSDHSASQRLVNSSRSRRSFSHSSRVRWSMSNVRERRRQSRRGERRRQRTPARRTPTSAGHRIHAGRPESVLPLALGAALAPRAPIRFANRSAATSSSSIVTGSALSAATARSAELAGIVPDQSRPASRTTKRTSLTALPFPMDDPEADRAGHVCVRSRRESFPPTDDGLTHASYITALPPAH